jgi:putative ABC transport system permease protein
MRAQAPAAGRFIDAEDVRLQRRVVFIGSEVARKIFGQVQPVGETVRLQGMSFTVIGVQKEKVQLSNYGRPDKESVFIPYTTAGQLWNTEYLSDMVYQAVDPALEAKARAQVMDALGKRLGFDPRDERAIEIFGSAQTQEITDGIVLGLKLVLSFIGVLTLAIGGVGVMNIMFVSVTERTREIGLRKALGATKRDVAVQFLAEAVTLTGVGGAIGIAVGLGAALTARLAFDFQAAAPLWSVLLGFGVSTAVGLVAGIWPAVKAARKDPIEALRYE